MRTVQNLDINLNPDSFKNPVVFFANGIGDHVLALPALRALSTIFPDRLSLIALPDMAEQIFADVEFSNIYAIHKQNQNIINAVQKVGKAVFDHKRLSEEIGNCDLFISLAEWQSESLVNLISCLTSAVTIGFFDNFTYSLNINYFHTADRIFAPVNIFNKSLRIENFAFPLKVTEKYYTLASNFRNALEGEFKLLVIHSDTKSQKMWCPSKFLKVIDDFLRIRPDFFIVIVGNWLNIEISKSEFWNRIFLCFNLPLSLAIALTCKADLFLGIDSCFLHVADLCKINGVGIFGPTDPRRWGFRFSRHIHLTGNPINSITENEVLNALLKLC